ncbi:MAG: hypothetical protein JWM73_2475 [Solirubrobacterales bacterium]|nr:hypothetical protein [Solirubrobacterales bacterium]
MRAWPWPILAVALGVRLLVLVAAGAYHPFGDAIDYDALARSLVDHGHYGPSQFAALGSPSAFRPPGYPYLLAAIYGTFGKSYLVARVAGAVLGTISVLLVWQIVRRLFDERLARWSAGVAAVAPSLAWVGSGLLAENLFVPLVLAAVLAVVAYRAAPSWRWALAGGALLGVAALTRSNGIILVIPLLFGVWQAARRPRHGLVFVLGLAAALAPWTIRNAVVLDTFAPLGTQTGITMAGVFNEGATSSAYYGVWRPPQKIRALRRFAGQPGTTEAQLDTRFRTTALRFAADHPGYTAKVTLHHVGQMLELRDTRIVGSNSQREEGMPSGAARRISRGGFLLLLALAAGGAVAARRRLWSLRLAWFWAVPLLLVIGVAPFCGGARYRVPADPFLCVLAAAALVTLRGRIAARRA